MPDPGDDLEARVSRLEGEVARLRDGVSVSRADAAAARVLAGGADRDISDVRTELRAHTQVLNALRETQIEQGRHLSQLDTKVTGLDAKVIGLDAKVDQLDTKVDQALGMLSTGMAQIVALLSGPRDKDG
jgi:outer membrane murein-binding lipoprotein Lpp